VLYPLVFIFIQAVENPTHQEIRDVLSAAGMKIGVENKLYSREKSKEPLYCGRIRVQLKADDGTPLNPEFPSRKLCLHYEISGSHGGKYEV
jgi:signal recognition particle subunit SRP19